MTAPDKEGGGIFIAMAWMMLLSVLLFWIPVLGALFAGFVGGKKAGGLGAAITAVFLPALLIGAGLFLFAALLTGLPGMGLLAGVGGMTLALLNVGPLLFGAIFGAVLRD